ncbi:hypothetical protein OHC33_007476 [Knufia fluminis]|uniref:Protein SMG7 n=1 Tax=Knufia fluminis TaxID=191047 RepID=A0AAN8EK74_9EURO|nr:hypothetical protein OHC33_007476 [Knufia fluminis]
METHAEEASKAVKSAERKLQHALRQKEPDYAALEPALEKLRVRCGNLALLYLISDQSAEQTETKLWNAHVEVKEKFKAWLKTFRDAAGKKKHVERRKAEKLYIDFIRASQRFYRAYIGRLIANFTNIPKVVEIAHKLGQDGLTVQTLKSATDEQVKILETSCKQCIIRLGDLSRWRESELQLKERNWGPAKGYYDLALSLDPTEGNCYNQHAAIALANDNHLGAIYYLHRAATVAQPNPLAPGNLGKQFERIRRLRNEESYGLMERSGEDLVSTLEKRFLAFHATCYSQPYDFVAFQQKATDILGMVALCFQDTKHGLFDHFLQRACLVNMAAEALAKQGMKAPAAAVPAGKLEQEVERNCQSYFLLQRFNLMTFQSLLKVLARELGEPVSEGQDLADLSRLSPVVRRVLPHLRQYSSWFLSNMRDLVETKFKSSRRLLEQVSKTYAQALNLLRGNVDVFASSPILHLLDEDEKSLSFSSFSPQVQQWRYLQADKKTLKPRRVDDGKGKELVEELAETHLRATDLVVDALKLVMHKDDLGLNVVPLALDNGQFIEQAVPDPEMPIRAPTPPPSKQKWRLKHAPTASMNGSSESPSRPVSGVPVLALSPDVNMADASPRREPANMSRPPPTLESSVAMQTAMEEMPATLNSSSVVTGTPAAPPPASASLTAMDLVRQMQRSSVGSPASQRSPDSGNNFSQPALPSVYKAAFAPTASEQAQLSPRLETAQRRSPSFATPEVNSSAMFQDHIARQQQEIQLRSSPQPTFQPTQSWTNYGQTPTGLDSLFRAFEKGQDRTPSPFGGPHGQANGRGGRPKSTAQPSPFGVIGQARTISHGTPPNGQG